MPQRHITKSGHEPTKRSKIREGERRRGAREETYLACGFMGYLVKQGMASDAFVVTPQQKQVLETLSREMAKSIPLLIAEALHLLDLLYLST
jgi:hypothetical protein